MRRALGLLVIAAACWPATSLAQTPAAPPLQVDHAAHQPAPPSVPASAPAAVPTVPLPPLIPPVTDADRAAAFPDIAGHAAHDNAVHFFVLFDQLEWLAGRGGGDLSWDNKGWIGRDRTRLWFRTEGAREDVRVEGAQAHLLYGRAISRWWDVVAGVRQDVRPRPDLGRDRSPRSGAVLVRGGICWRKGPYPCADRIRVRTPADQPADPLAPGRGRDLRHVRSNPWYRRGSQLSRRRTSCAVRIPPRARAVCRREVERAVLRQPISRKLPARRPAAHDWPSAFVSGCSPFAFRSCSTSGTGSIPGWRVTANHAPQRRCSVYENCDNSKFRIYV